ncbi:N-acetylgalactosamine-4-sulfatase precursor [Lentisphaera araneosa HTCC2155]|uniref:N-acetylgalactosamine-4-sulfatase n=1 Tax=Lentisphaera araneosa HTCC2155 TaxID=313628 RepID=A6DFL3_9BACT|nr:arylsulfatase [Lentisphaera araneosa]EDM29593.1 N-acetylgalactosamine-4-sulfatase precursor [Lentisphaera araneosa HTCC2155]
MFKTLFIIFITSLSLMADKPNIILIITDDQGYGDLACHGNPWIKTPHLDKFHSESLRLNNYHVDPTCAPTRAALMTGRYSGRNGVWHTVNGRNMLRSREKTMASVLKDNGYTNGIFGKWHLGDSYPFRPQDRGFDQVVIHGAGGIHQTPDYFGNDYFDDTYLVNGKWKKFEGYCTDIWFDQAIDFIKKNKSRPFFAYISPNAPHTPLNCPEEYEAPYRGNPNIAEPAFYGMVTNIDDNFAKLEKFLKAEGLYENTLVIFTTDNGSAKGIVYDKKAKKKLGFTANMRGQKGSQYEGGHRVPFFMRWPAGKIGGNRDINTLSAHIDILPTLIDMISLKSDTPKLDGSSLKDLIYTQQNNLAERTLIVENQRLVTPEKWRRCSVMYKDWRLVDGKELYKLSSDPEQKNDIAKSHPEIVARLRETYEQFWMSTSADHHLNSSIIVGSEKENPLTLTSHDLLSSKTPWNHRQVEQGMKTRGKWMLKVAEAGKYKITFSRWPKELDKPINSDGGVKGKIIHAQSAHLEIQGQKRSTKLSTQDKSISFTIELKQELSELVTEFQLTDGSFMSAYYCYVELIE